MNPVAELGALSPLTVARAVAVFHRLRLLVARLLMIAAHLMHRCYTRRTGDRMRVHQKSNIEYFRQCRFSQNFELRSGRDCLSLFDQHHTIGELGGKVDVVCYYHCARASLVAALSNTSENRCLMCNVEIRSGLI